MGRIALRLAAALAIALALAACSAQPTATSPTMTPGPTATDAASGFVEHPTEAHVVVLRLESGGGLVSVDFFATQLPTFSLFGAGTVLYAEPLRAGRPGLPGPLPLRKATMDEAQMSALLAFALGQGGLGEARADYLNPPVTDAPTSVFTIRASGLDKTVSVYALGIDSSATPDQAIRARFQQLSDLLSAFDTQVRTGRATGAGPYDPPAYRAVLSEAQGVPGDVDVRGWPWDDLTLADFKPRPNDGRRYAVITLDQARLLGASPQGGLFPVAVRGPDGVTYTIALRPLLPDETQ